ncbi:MAG: aminoacylase, partial [Ruminococcaceae bacterium]|nr:aminoacylase [Oscillospiraceae bacterium]
MLDMLIKNAEVFDGTGAESRVVNVGVADGKISYISEAEADAVVVIDGSGLSLAPGFIDVHTHSDTQLFLDPSRWCKLKQGVTTEVGGQCGWSPAPYSASAPADFRGYISTIGVQPDLETFADAMNHLDTLKVGTHQATFVGHHYLRGSVAGMENRPVSAKELDRMCALAEEAMQSGAMGFSTGLVYAPGVYATTDELAAIAKVVGRYGGKYTTHMRDEGDHLIESVQEAIRVGAEGGIPVNISHLKALFPQNFHKIDTVLEMIDKENAKGAQITFDVYPYAASSATLLSTLPPSYLSHGMDWLIEHLEGEENIEALREAIYHPTESWENPVAKIGVQNHLISRALGTPE